MAKTKKKTSKKADQSKAKEKKKVKVEEKQMVYVDGIDVSHWQGSITWATVKNSGLVTFAIAKATEGTTFTDSRFAQNWAGIKSNGLIRGAYHFFKTDVSGAAQAAHFLNVLNQNGSVEADDLPPAVDIEYDASFEPGWTIDGVKGDLAVWLTTVEQALGRKPLIYTNYNTWVNILGDPPDFADYPLWIASYTGGPGSIMLGAWNNWVFWQHSSTGQIPGITGNVDLNRFNGTLDELGDFIGFCDGDFSEWVSLGGAPKRARCGTQPGWPA